MARAALSEEPGFIERRVFFHCPGCGCAHLVIVDGRGAWGWNGDLELPTFTPSVLVRYDVSPPNERLSTRCHSFVTDGRIQFLDDSTHHLTGQTVDLPEWPYTEDSQ